MLLIADGKAVPGVQFYNPEELTAIEAGADSVNGKAQANLLPPFM